MLFISITVVTSSGDCQYVHHPHSSFTGLACTPGCPYITSTTIRHQHPYTYISQGDIHLYYDDKWMDTDIHEAASQCNTIEDKLYIFMMYYFTTYIRCPTTVTMNHYTKSQKFLNWEININLKQRYLCTIMRWASFHYHLQICVPSTTKARQMFRLDNQISYVYQDAIQASLVNFLNIIFQNFGTIGF